MSQKTLFILHFMIHAMMKSAKMWTDELDQASKRVKFKTPLSAFFNHLSRMNWGHVTMLSQLSHCRRLSEAVENFYFFKYSLWLALLFYNYICNNLFLFFCFSGCLTQHKPDAGRSHTSLNIIGEHSRIRKAVPS